MDLLRHVEANEFSYGCTFCKKIYTSHAHRLRHHQKHHPNQPRPKKYHNATYAHDAASTTLHSTTNEIQHLRRRQKSRTPKSSPPFVPIPIVPAPIVPQDDAAAHWSSGFVDWLVNPNVRTPQPLQNDGDIDFLITQVSPSIPPLPTLSFADYIEIDDTDDIVTSATTPSPSLPPLPTLSFADYIDLDDTDDITTSATPSLARTILLQTPPSSPVMNYDLDN